MSEFRLYEDGSFLVQSDSVRSDTESWMWPSSVIVRTGAAGREWRGFELLPRYFAKMRPTFCGYQALA